MLDEGARRGIRRDPGLRDSVASTFILVYFAMGLTPARHQLLIRCILFSKSFAQSAAPAPRASFLAVGHFTTWLQALLQAATLYC